MSPVVRYTIDSAAKVSIIMRASLSLMSPNSLIGRPNWRRDLEATAQIAEQVLARDAHVVEVERGRRRSLDAELLLFGARAHPHRTLDQEGRDAILGLPVAGDQRLGEDGEEVGHAAVGDPDLGPVEEEAPV